jgi:nicotinamide-nucleotide amidase
MRNRVEDLSKRLRARGWFVVAAESCTGGGLAHLLTSLPGSSTWFERGFVTYSNLAKQEMLGVNHDTLARCGAVSGETAGEMATGALAHSHGQISVAITGIAGPEGGVPGKPVGTVWIAWAVRSGKAEARLYHFTGDREAVRRQAIEAALNGLLERLP